MDRRDEDQLTLNKTVSDDVDYTDYRFEAARLDSFADWPVSFIDPKKLAAAGFFYTKEGDKVKCFECSVIISNWEDGDDPMKDHQRWSGRCRFIRNRSCGNVPLGANPSTIPKTPRPNDVCGLYGLKYMMRSISDNNLETQETTEHIAAYCEPTKDMEITVFWDSDTKRYFTAKFSDVLGSKRPTYASYERRLDSFATWPDTTGQNKEDLAAAGFYYLSGCFPKVSTNDQTMCFYCEGFLTSWESEDDPVEEHFKYYPNCKFIKKVIAERQLKEKNALEKKNDVVTKEIMTPAS